MNLSGSSLHAYVGQDFKNHKMKYFLWFERRKRLMRGLFYCSAIWSMTLMITGVSACGTRTVLFIDASGNHRVVEEPITINGQMVRSCGGGKVVYTDPASGKKFVVDQIIDRTKTR